jgi:hypothetical protein
MKCARNSDQVMERRMGGRIMIRMPLLTVMNDRGDNK